MDALGTETLTVQIVERQVSLFQRLRLLNPSSARSTQAMYDEKRMSAISPAFADVRKIRDRIAAHRKVEFPAGTGFSGTSRTLLLRSKLKNPSTVFSTTCKPKTGLYPSASDISTRQYPRGISSWW
jgi:hypothetical protein